MPYKDAEEALSKHPNLSKYSAKARRGWVSAFNSAIEGGKDESAAFAIAYSVANKVDDKDNINQKSASILRFGSQDEAIQFLSDLTNLKIIIKK